MATVDETVREGILCYPLIHVNRFSVLHHVLCVIGNGYEWINGEPIAYEGDKREHWTPEGEDARNRASYHYTPLLSDFYAEQSAIQAAVVAEIDTRMYDLTQHREALYPQSEYAKLMTMPDDVTDDWRAACEWMRDYASKNGWKF